MFASIANLKHPIVFRDALNAALGPGTLSLLWPSACQCDAEHDEVAHTALIGGPLASDAYVHRALGSLEGATVILELYAPMLVPRYRLRKGGHTFMVPEFARANWSEEQLAWLDANCEQMPMLTGEEACSRGRRIVEDLLGRSNTVVLCDAFEYVEDPVPEHYPSGYHLMTDLAKVNVLARELSAEHGALIVHGHIAMCEVGAEQLGADFRKQGEGTAKLIAEELLSTLEFAKGRRERSA